MPRFSEGEPHLRQATERPDAGEGVGRGAAWYGVADLIAVRNRNAQNLVA